MSNASLLARILSGGGLTPPQWTTAGRPANPAEGAIGYNTTLHVMEVYTGNNTWQAITASSYTYAATYLAIAGGGGGYFFGGAAAGGYLTNSFTMRPGTTYTVTVGAGGAGATRGGDSSISGSDLTTITALNNGSGYGGLNNDPGGAGIAGQGYAGGAGKSDGATYNSGGGGGGAGGVGGASGGTSTGSAGLGGVGASSSITGSAVFYGGGGGGAGDARQGVYGNYGGSSIGGTGGSYGNSWNGQNGTVNTGSGGGGAGYTGSGYGAQGQGGSGVVIFSVPTANYTGLVTGSPTVTTSGANTIIKFTGSGTYTA